MAAPRHHCNGNTIDRGNRNNHEGRGGQYHTFTQYTASSGTVFILGLDDCTSYCIKCFNSEKWGHYKNLCPEEIGDKATNKSGRNLSQIIRCLTQVHSDDTVNNNSLILDLFSNISCTKNNTIASNFTVGSPAKHLWVYRNGGNTDYTMKVTLSIYL